MITLSITRVNYGTISFMIVGSKSWKNLTEGESSTVADCSRAVNNGSWYNFSSPPLFVFYVYSAFLVDQEPHNMIRLISITSLVELFARLRLEVFCVVYYADQHLPHVAPILSPPPKRILEPATLRNYQVGDYVYNCPLSKDRRNSIPVSIAHFDSELTTGHILRLFAHTTHHSVDP